MKAKRMALAGLGLCAITAVGAAGFTAWRDSQKDHAEFGAEAQLLPARLEEAKQLGLPFSGQELKPPAEPDQNMAEVMIAVHEEAREDELPSDIEAVRAALQQPASAPRQLRRRDQLMQAALLDVSVFPNTYDQPPNLTVNELQALRVSNNALLGSAAAAIDQGDMELAGRILSANDRLLRRSADLDGDLTLLAYVRGSIQMNAQLARLLTERPEPATARFVLQVLRGFEHPPTVEKIFRLEFVKMWTAAELYPQLSEDEQGLLNAAGSNDTLELPESPQRLASMRSVLLRAWLPAFEAARKGGDPEQIGGLIDKEIMNASDTNAPNAYFLRASSASFGQTARSLRRSADQRLALAWAAEVILGERPIASQEPPRLNLAGYVPAHLTSARSNGLTSVSLWSGQNDKPVTAAGPGFSEDMVNQQFITFAFRQK
jgi:hypothetical protein